MSYMSMYFEKWEQYVITAVIAIMDWQLAFYERLWRYKW